MNNRWRQIKGAERMLARHGHLRVEVHVTICAIPKKLPVTLIFPDPVKEDVNISRHTPCESCRHYLGGGCCRINLEAECREGGGFEAWEPQKIVPMKRCANCIHRISMQPMRDGLPPLWICDVYDEDVTPPFDEACHLWEEKNAP